MALEGEKEEEKKMATRGRKTSVSRNTGRKGSVNEKTSATDKNEKHNQAQGRKENKDNFSCGSCGMIVLDDDAALECELCNFWYHCTCQKISTKLYNTISKLDEDDDGVHWYCKTCNKTAKSMMTMMTSLKIQHTKLESSVAELREEMHECKTGCVQSHSELRQEMRDMFDRQGSPVMANPDQIDQAETYEIMNKVMKERFDEIDEKEKRKTNIIFFGVQESASGEPATRKRDDETKIRAMIDRLPNKSLEIRTLYRLGKKEDTKTRPLKVVMNNQAMRDEILQKFRKGELDLSAYDEGVVQLSRDRTKTEREEYRKLRNELRERKERGENDLVIRNGQIRKQTFRPHGEEPA